jgi:hypothetical protein
MITTLLNLASKQKHSFERDDNYPAQFSFETEAHMGT